MRTPKDAAKNEFLLRVSGEKIAPPKRAAAKKTYYKVRAPVDEPCKYDDGDEKNLTGECDRQVLPLKETHVKNSDVCSPQLRQIRETVEIDGFQRLLRRLNVTPAATQQRSPARHQWNAAGGVVNPADVYKEFFQDHYDNLLRDVTGRLKKKCN